MNKLVLQFITIASVAFTAQAAEPNTFFAGVDGGTTKIDSFGASKGSYGAMIGYNFRPNLAVEINARHLGDWNVNGAKVDANQYAASMIGSLPVAQNFNFFARLGYNKIEAETDYRGFHIDASNSGGLLGLGISYNFTVDISGRLEFQKPSTDSHAVIAGVSIQF